jgi:hypothetical protein
MGLPCDPTASTGNACGAWCVGIAGGAAHCTRECGSAADCPGGFACSRTTGGEDVCVQVNIACPSTANQCPSGIGACGGGPGSGTWCTARCRSAADCPRLGEGVPPYVCEVDPGLGFSVCQITPEMDPYVGERGLGESCSPGVTGCRSGLCADDGTGSAPYCIERCTARGGCPHGFGCAPYRTGAGSAYSLFCVVAGSGNAGDPCEDNRDCRSGYCDTDACTRICNDGFCPSGMTCASSGITADGAAIRVCR